MQDFLVIHIVLFPNLKGDTNLEIVKRVLAEFTGLYDGVKKPDIEILGNFVRVHPFS